MNERIKELAVEAALTIDTTRGNTYVSHPEFNKKFAELIVEEMCGLMGQEEDDAYHCFEPSERPTERIEWLRDWQERFTKHFGVEE